MPSINQQPPTLTQHNVEIHENLAHWNKKPLLQQVYREFYQEIAAQLAFRPEGPVVECGSGIGNLKEQIPDCVTTDLFPNPWIDQTEDVYKLSFKTMSTSAFILFDVFHHLEHPGEAFAELHRALKPRGKLIIFEPAAGLFGRFVLCLFHHEPFGLKKPIAWHASSGWSPKDAAYYAAQGNAWRIFRNGEYSEQLSDWNIVSVHYHIALLWLLSGGFRGPTLIPKALAPVVRAVERLLTPFSEVLSSRMMVVLEKR